MQIIPFVDTGLGNSSYLVDLEDGDALAIDPGRDVAPYRQEAERRGRRITHSIETHLHADFVSGSRELATHGARVVAPFQAGLEFPHTGVGSGGEMDLGGLTLRALHTPGHTPEHLAYLLLDGGRPLALFSGGSLLVGGVARTDLISPEQTEELTRELYRSIREHLLDLPDDLAVYPTHGAGSFCTAGGSEERTTTIGRERASHPLLSIEDEETFVSTLLEGFGSYPLYFSRLREVNRRGPKVYGDRPPTLRSLAPDRVRHLMADGAELVDVRPTPQFAAGHVPGALSIALRDSFASWLGWLAPHDRPVVFVLDQRQDRAELVRQCLKIGYESLAGELAGGMQAWRAAGLEERVLALVEARNLPTGTVLDVRQEDEFWSGHIPGATHVELGSLPEAAASLPGGSVTVYCSRGDRAMTGASLLERLGR
ncbi:MAG: rhodanese-like domain-containing protein, partial [Acidimicrobiia bacterium]